LWIRDETHERNPLSVILVSDDVFAVSKSVPELDGSITRTRHDLTIVGREGDGENVVGVANKTAGSGAGGELPESEGFVPGRRKSVCAIGGDNAVGNDV